MNVRKIFFAGGILASGIVCAQDVADTIYSGGPILTINDSPPTAEAVAVVDGRSSASIVDTLNVLGPQSALPIDNAMNADCDHHAYLLIRFLPSAEPALDVPGVGRRSMSDVVNPRLSETG